jgi:hypothetical protein
MGLKDLLFGSGETREERQINKIKKRLLNPHRQTDDRKFAVQELMQIGSHEAVQALLQRFTYRTENSITDESEKVFVFECLVEVGDSARAALEEHILSRPEVYWALRAHRQISGDEAALDLLLRALDTVESGYSEQERRKTELISNLREFQDDRALERLILALEDTNDDVRVMAVEGLLPHGPRKSLKPLVDRLLDPNESGRIRTVILEVLADAKWSLKKFRASLDGHLPPAYNLDSDGFITRQ